MAKFQMNIDKLRKEIQKVVQQDIQFSSTEKILREEAKEIILRFIQKQLKCKPGGVNVKQQIQKWFDEQLTKYIYNTRKNKNNEEAQEQNQEAYNDTIDSFYKVLKIDGMRKKGNFIVMEKNEDDKMKKGLCLHPDGAVYLGGLLYKGGDYVYNRNGCRIEGNGERFQGVIRDGVIGEDGDAHYEVEGSFHHGGEGKIEGGLINAQFGFKSKGEFYKGPCILNKELSKFTRNGKGEYYYSNGDKYEGEWKNNKRQGKGKLILQNTTAFYDGDWDNDQAKGYGKMTYSNGDIYQGLFENGRKSGEGTLKFLSKSNQSFYKGGWKNDKMHTDEKHKEGVLKFSRKESYKGEWYEGYKSGFGVYTYPGTGKKSAKRYAGEFVMNKRHGRGEMLYNNNDKYVGDWFNGVKHGIGTYTKGDGLEFYEGYWHEGEMHGRGIYAWKKRKITQKYVGEWKHGNMDGQGTFYYDNESFIEGKFNNGKLSIHH